MQESDKRIELKEMSAKSNAPPLPAFSPKKVANLGDMQSKVNAELPLVKLKESQKLEKHITQKLIQDLLKLSLEYDKDNPGLLGEKIKAAIIAHGITIEEFFFKLMRSARKGGSWFFFDTHTMDYTKLVILIMRECSGLLDFRVAVDTTPPPGDFTHVFLTGNPLCTVVAELARYQFFDTLEWVLDNRKQNPSRNELESYRIALYFAAQHCSAPKTLIKKLMDCLIANKVSIKLSENMPSILYYLLERDEKKYEQKDEQKEGVVTKNSLITTAIEYIEPSEFIRQWFVDPSPLEIAFNQGNMDLTKKMVERLPASTEQYLSNFISQDKSISQFSNAMKKVRLQEAEEKSMSPAFRQ